MAEHDPAAAATTRPVLDEARKALASGQSDRALQILRTIATNHANDSIALHDAGVMLASARLTGEAIDYFQRSIEANPNFARARFNLGLALRILGRADEAIQQFRLAMQIAPDAVEPCIELADVMGDVGRTEESIALLDAAAIRFANSDRFHATRAHLLRRVGRLDQAAESLRRAIALSDKPISHLCNLALMLNELGRADDADATLAPILASNPPDSIRLRSAVSLPAICESVEQIHRARSRLEGTLDDLRSTTQRVADPIATLNSIPFYLAYAGLNDRPILEKLAAVHERICPSLRFTANHCRQPRALGGRKIRIGIISTNLYAHTIGRLNLGLIEHLDRDRFEVFVLENNIDDAIANRIRAAADHAIRTPQAFAGRQQAIADCELDVLFYPDIGMVPLTYYLAFARLAPVQCVTWGHPLTSGLTSLDHFISSTHLESERSQSQYVERLHCLSVPGTCYAKPQHQPMNDARAHFGFARDWRLHLCPQSLFKIHPEFDQVLATLLQEDSAARIVLVSGSQAAMFPALRNRFEKTMGGDVDRVILLPALPGNDFLSLLSIADANLDTLHFGGGHTSLEAFAVGCPVVTLPGDFLRSRITYALYQQMGLTDCIASNVNEYVRIALRLANDRAWHVEQREQILAGNHRLFDNRQMVRELEDFFSDAVTSRARA